MFSQVTKKHPEKLCFIRSLSRHLFGGFKLNKPDVELSTRSSSAGVIQSDAHQDGRSQRAQRNIHLETGPR